MHTSAGLAEGKFENFVCRGKVNVTCLFVLVVVILMMDGRQGKLSNPQASFSLLFIQNEALHWLMDLTEFKEY